MRKPPVHAVLFDLDDTLFDHTRSSRTVLSGLYERHACFRTLGFDPFAVVHTALLDELHAEVLGGRISVDDARLERIRRLFAAVDERPPQDLVARVAREYRDAYVESWRPVPGAVELLQQLRGHVRLGVVTNNIVAEQQMKVDVCGLRPWLDVLVISEEAGATKPDPRIFEIALDRIGCRADSTVMVGDAWVPDIVGAHGVSIRPVWLNRAGLARPDPTLAVTELRAFEPLDDAVGAILGAHS